MVWVFWEVEDQAEHAQEQRHAREPGQQQRAAAQTVDHGQHHEGGQDQGHADRDRREDTRAGRSDAGPNADDGSIEDRDDDASGLADDRQADAKNQRRAQLWVPEVAQSGGVAAEALPEGLQLLLDDLAAPGPRERPARRFLVAPVHQPMRGLG
jgi:hypothetical protein